MIEEALAYFADLVVKAAAPVKIESGDPRKIAHVFGGQMVSVDTEPAPRKHTVKILRDLIELSNRFAAEAADDDGADSPAVWYDESRVVLVIDDDGHRLETVTLPLEKSDVFATLERLAASKLKLDQKSFVRLLRIDLAGTLDPVVLLEKVRRVEFENGSTVSANIGRQKESLGRSITSQARTDGGDLPEEVVLLVPVYKTSGERSPIPCRCSVEVDPAEGTFRLLPLPDELERVQQVAMGRVAGSLSEGLENGVPAYYGAP